MDLTTLRAGDQVTIAVVGANATKAHIRVNGAPYEETTNKNAAGEYILSFPIPSGTYNFTIEAEVYQNGTWQ